jgi:hypothetical protein
MKKTLSVLFLIIPILLSAQTNFGGLGSDNSGGAGFKTVSSNSNIIVSNVMINDGTEMYIGSSGTYSFVIKAKGTTVNTFTFSDMRIHRYNNTALNIDASSTVTFKAQNGSTLQTMTLNAQKELSSAISIRSFFDNGTATPINNVSEIVVSITASTVTQDINYIDITLSNYALPVELNSFYANILDEGVKLNWSTATEVNNFGFEVERTAYNNISWQKIGFIQGYGNSNSPKEYSFIDKPNGGSEYRYRLKQIDIDGKYEYSPEVEVKLETPIDFSVKQNYPNPFNPTTKIEFSTPSDNNVEIKIYNALGMEVRTLLNENRQAGTHSIEFNASNLSSGIYFYKIVSGNYSEIKKMILLR